MKETGEADEFSGRKQWPRSVRRTLLRVAILAAARIAFALVLSGSSFVYATRVAPGKRAQLTSPETVGPLLIAQRGFNAVGCKRGLAKRVSRQPFSSRR
jgi:hypothetical protein